MLMFLLVVVGWNLSFFSFFSFFFLSFFSFFLGGGGGGGGRGAERRRLFAYLVKEIKNGLKSIFLYSL